MILLFIRDSSLTSCNLTPIRFVFSYGNSLTQRHDRQHKCTYIVRLPVEQQSMSTRKIYSVCPPTEQQSIIGGSLQDTKPSPYISVLVLLGPARPNRRK